MEGASVGHFQNVFGEKKKKEKNKESKKLKGKNQEPTEGTASLLTLNSSP